MRLTYSKKQLVNLGNYENITYEISANDEVLYVKDETKEECFERLKLFVDNQMKSTVGCKVNEQVPVKVNEEISIIDKLRSKLKQLIAKDPDNRESISSILGYEFNVTKITDLTSDQQLEFLDMLNNIKC